MIYLIWGPPGSGKSTIAQALSKRLGEIYFDLDQWIVQSQGMSITEIFSLKGESFFRQIEAEALAQLCHRQESAVIALGGGTLCFEAAQILIQPYLAQKKLMIFTLQCPLDLLIERMRGDQSRPLLQGDQQIQKLTDLIERRKNDYLKTGIPILIQRNNSIDQSVEQLYAALIQSHPNHLTLQDYQIQVVHDQSDELIEKIKKLAIITMEHQADQSIKQVSKLIIVTDDHVKKLYVDGLINRCFQQGILIDVFSFQPGDAQKNIHTLTNLYDFCIERGIQRQDYLIAFGGGVVGDLCGFAASTLLRGIRWVQIPTTLLSQVDSSIGAKTGINHLGYKNMIGSFYPPVWVWIDVSYLLSLDQAQIKSGWAEAIKHALIWDAPLFALIVEFLEKGQNLSQNLSQSIISHQFCYLIYRILRVKAQIVQLDPLENGIRKLLNFGHSIGHAIESMYFEIGQSIEHGLAVAIGMSMMVEMSTKYGLSLTEKEMILNLFKSLGFDLDWRKSLAKALPYLSKDKKTSNDQITEIFLTSIGKAKMVKLSISTFKDEIVSI
jgi:3-dehydroquinate synthase